MTYEEAAAYIEGIPRFTKKHDLSYVADFLARLGNPGADSQVIHVAGTNGKGSVCAYMRAVLLAMGKRTGFFTSPHLIRLNERIVIGDDEIGDEEFLAVFRQVKETVDGMAEEGLSHPSYFEFLFGMAMLAFGRAGAEYIILETGLGGRLTPPARCRIRRSPSSRPSVWTTRRTWGIRWMRSPQRRPASSGRACPSCSTGRTRAPRR